MSYKAQIKVFNDPTFYDNVIRLATAEEAEAYGKNTVWNWWTLADKYRVVESDEPVNYQWDSAKGLVRLEAPSC